MTIDYFIPIDYNKTIYYRVLKLFAMLLQNYLSLTLSLDFVSPGIPFCH